MTTGALGMTDREEKATLDARLDVSGRYLGLLTTLPTQDDGTGAVEVSTTNTAYARVAITGTGTSDWEAAASGSLGNPTQKKGPRSGITWAFPTPQTSGTPANWGTIVGWGIWDASTSGNLLYVGALASSPTVNSGDAAPQFDSTHQVIVQLGDVGDSF